MPATTDQPPRRAATHLDRVRAYLRAGDPLFWRALAESTRAATDFTELLTLVNLRKKAERAAIASDGRRPLRAALLGGSNLYPMQELVEQFLGVAPGGGWRRTEMFVGAYDNYPAEMLEAGGDLDQFQPEVILLIPSDGRCRYEGALTDARERQREAAERQVRELLEMCGAVHDRTGAEVIVMNYLPPSEMDPGTYRTRSLGSAWNFRKLVNQELGLEAPAYVQVCDVEFLASRRGTSTCVDARRWFESRQIYSPEFAVEVAREAAHLVASLHVAPKKVLALDLDDTLWGGVIGEDGLAGIEIGTTTPRGEAFRAFQESVLALTKRGVLLAICSKNDEATALEPFERHPEMVLRRSDIASFQAGWGPKPDSLRRVAEELNVGLDSIVFVDDNPAEIEIVRQFLPEVEAILLGPDPAEYRAELLNARMFEPRSITADDLGRCTAYQQQALRGKVPAGTADMTSYLQSLGMRCSLSSFAAIDVARISQLINKSNQFNLTTRRRSEAEVRLLMEDPGTITLNARMSDRFGDYGLISVVVAEVEGGAATIDTWLMSCRVLKRELEFEMLTELVKRARALGCDRLVGRYRRTAKNAMVRELYLQLGFALVAESDAGVEYVLSLSEFAARRTAIATEGRQEASLEGEMEQGALMRG